MSTKVVYAECNLFRVSFAGINIDCAVSDYRGDDWPVCCSLFVGCLAVAWWVFFRPAREKRELAK